MLQERKRGSLLNIWLQAMWAFNGLVVFFVIVLWLFGYQCFLNPNCPSLLERSPSAVIGIFAILNLWLIRQVFHWKRSGYYGLLIVAVVNALFNLSPFGVENALFNLSPLGFGIWFVLGGVLPLLILSLLLMPQRELFK